MKRILITGSNSYIGTSFEKWLAQWSENYQVDTVGTRDSEWKEKDFSQYDVVFHVSGIAHIKETKENEHLYYEVNTELAIDIAKKSKAAKVKQFIFLSSMSVYGLDKGIITKDTPLNPKNAYGKSKMLAEQEIRDLKSSEFFIAILRPPMIYGKGCKGNYQTLSKFAKVTPIFPNINTKRSMVYVDTLNEYVRYLIDFEMHGEFFPQNEEYVNIHILMKEISESNNHRIIFIKSFNSLVYVFMNRLNVVSFSKIFGSLIYDTDTLHLKDFYNNSNYSKFSFKESIRLTEK